MKFSIIGRTSYLYDTAKLMISKGHELVLVATRKAAPEYTRTQEDFEELAKSCGAIFINTPKLKENLDKMVGCDAEIALSMNWINVLDDMIISLFPLGILNAHPGMLPRYRGNACPNWAILT